MLSSELEFCLNEAFQTARDRRHEFMTVEHLLLALLDIPKVHEILKSCDSDVSQLRRQLSDFVVQATPLMPPESESDVQPTLGFQRVLQRAVFGQGCEKCGNARPDPIPMTPSLHRPQRVTRQTPDPGSGAVGHFALAPGAANG